MDTCNGDNTVNRMQFYISAAQQMFPNSQVPKSQYSHHLGENECCQKINKILHILSPHLLKFIDKCQRYGHFNACG